MLNFTAEMKGTDLKKAVFAQCKTLLEDRITHAENAMKAAQEAANSEDKSSAGDKYETARAMGQLDRDMNARQLAQAQAELNALLKVNTELVTEKVMTGSIIETDAATYFIAAGIGNIEVDGHKFTVLSPRAPLAAAMLGKQQGDSFLFNGRPVKITACY